MTYRRWKQLAGLCALTALAFHGVGALGHFNDPGIWNYDGWDHFQHVLLLALPELPSGQPPPSVDRGIVVGPPTPPAESALASLPLSRGPPTA